MKLQTGDEVLVTAGKDKGRKGKIDKVFPAESKVRVENINVYKKHVKGLGDQKGGVIEFSRPLLVGNIALICPKCAKPTRIGYRIDKKGEKNRVCVKCGRAIDAPAAQKAKGAK